MGGLIVYGKHINIIQKYRKIPHLDPGSSFGSCQTKPFLLGSWCLHRPSWSGLPLYVAWALHLFSRAPLSCLLTGHWSHQCRTFFVFKGSSSFPPPSPDIYFSLGTFLTAPFNVSCNASVETSHFPTSLELVLPLGLFSLGVPTSRSMIDESLPCFFAWPSGVVWRPSCVHGMPGEDFLFELHHGDALWKMAGAIVEHTHDELSLELAREPMMVVVGAWCPFDYSIVILLVVVLCHFVLETLVCMIVVRYFIILRWINE